MESYLLECLADIPVERGDLLSSKYDPSSNVLLSSSLLLLSSIVKTPSPPHYFSAVYTNSSGAFIFLKAFVTPAVELYLPPYAAFIILTSVEAFSIRSPIMLFPLITNRLFTSRDTNSSYSGIRRAMLLASVNLILIKQAI